VKTVSSTTENVADLLLSAGWKSLGDAQYTGLDKIIRDGSLFTLSSSAQEGTEENEK
jgi:hypothetical protein